MNKGKTIEALNTLIEINNDRMEGYETASNETNDGYLKNLFFQLSQTSRKCKAELDSEVLKLGGIPIAGTKMSDKFFRVWKDVIAALTGNDRMLILNSCEFGEDIAIGTYNNVLKNSSYCITSEQQDILNTHYLLIKADHDRVIILRNMFVKRD